jgi:hypothetical protein
VYSRLISNWCDWKRHLLGDRITPKSVAHAIVQELSQIKCQCINLCRIYALGCCSMVCCITCRSSYVLVLQWHTRRGSRFFPNHYHTFFLFRQVLRMTPRKMKCLMSPQQVWHVKESSLLKAVSAKQTCRSKFTAQ